MIYLTRTTIDPDGTRTTETAVLEDGARLKAYKAQGWQCSTYEAWKAAQDHNIALTFDRLRARAQAQPPAVSPAEPTHCISCGSPHILKWSDGLWRCRTCRRAPFSSAVGALSKGQRS